MIEIVRIPDERKPILIGQRGKTKKGIEKCTGTSIEVSDDVTISGEDPLLVLKARDMVLAIGRGFSPKEARRLLDDGCELHVISLEGETLKKRRRLLGRVIGKQGKAKKRIEADTGASISIQGKTLALLGTHEEIGPAEDAIEELLAGKTHAYAYRRMYRKKVSV
jgi:ribosomal RNA assembly protein